MSAPILKLNDGNEVPQLGFGVFQIPVQETVEAVLPALRTGYRRAHGPGPGDLHGGLSGAYRPILVAANAMIATDSTTTATIS